MSNDLHLNPGLGRPPIVQNVVRVHVLDEGPHVLTEGLATGPLAGAHLVEVLDQAGVRNDRMVMMMVVGLWVARRGSLLLLLLALIKDKDRNWYILKSKHNQFRPHCC